MKSVNPELISTITQLKGTVAVLDFSNNSPFAQWQYMEKAIPDILSANLAKNPNISIVERRRLEKILNEISLGMTGVVDIDTAQRIGKIIGADMIIMGSVTKLGSTLIIASHIVKVETAEIIAGATEKGLSEDQLAVMLEALSDKIITSIP